MRWRGQQQLQMTESSSLRTMTAGVQLKKKILALSLKGLGTKTN
jgi:hypothetical protein